MSASWIFKVDNFVIFFLALSVLSSSRPELQLHIGHFIQVNVGTSEKWYVQNGTILLPPTKPGPLLDILISFCFVLYPEVPRYQDSKTQKQLLLVPPPWPPNPLILRTYKFTIILESHFIMFIHTASTTQFMFLILYWKIFIFFQVPRKLFNNGILVHTSEEAIKNSIPK